MPQKVVDVKRIVEAVTFRPLPQSGIDKMGRWIQQQNWKQIYKCTDINLKSEILQNMMKQKLDEFLPIKVIKLSSDDKPWINQQLKVLDRKCKREFFKHRKSGKWTTLRQIFEEKCEKAKEDYYTNTVQDLKDSNPNQWYSKVKRMGGIAENHTGDIQVEELDGISNLDQAERIAQHYANVSSEYKALGNDDIPRSEYSTEELPPFVEAYEMYDRIKKMSSKKATVKDDIPMAIIKEFAAELKACIQNSGNLKP